MTSRTAEFERFAAGAGPLVRVTVTEAKGSTPREAGAWMLVGQTGLFGTIGGGRLEFMAIDHARRLQAGEHAPATLSVPLGPGIGQCCGGNVALVFDPVDASGRERVARDLRAEDATAPAVYLFGAGHVGRALSQALALLPLAVTVVETRPEALKALAPEQKGGVKTHLSAVPETLIEAAPARSAFVVLTHDHALDFLLVQTALQRGDAAYAGMIGSKTKRATFERWYAKEAGGDPADCTRLVCPIGGGDVNDKRSAVIAGLVAAEIVRAVFGNKDG